jgi:hypothetical protein
VRATKLPAWRLSVQGKKCGGKSAVCDDADSGSWKIYSAEVRRATDA